MLHTLALAALCVTGTLITMTAAVWAGSIDRTHAHRTAHTAPTTHGVNAMVPLTVPDVIDEYIQAHWVWPRNPAAIRHIGLHTPQGPEMPRYARNLGWYFRDVRDRKASTHFGTDSVLAVRYARDDHTCAAAAGINTTGVHIEIAGVAEQSPEEWNDEFSRAAMWRAALISRLYGPDSRYEIPFNLLSPAELRRGLPGVVTHAVAWQVYGGDYRSDPGEHFPADLFLAMCRGEEENDMLLTAADLRHGHEAYRAGDRWAVALVQSTLRLPKLGHYTGRVDGVRGHRTNAAIIAAKAAAFPGRDDPGHVVGEAFWDWIICQAHPCPAPGGTDARVRQLEDDLRTEATKAARQAARADTLDAKIGDIRRIVGPR